MVHRRTKAKSAKRELEGYGWHESEKLQQGTLEHAMKTKAWYVLWRNGKEHSILESKTNTEEMEG